jgi:hypothetical protein
MGQESVRVRPGDQYRCGGCLQLLSFDNRGFTADATLRACESRCDWLLIERAGRIVTEDPGQTRPA